MTKTDATTPKLKAVYRLLEAYRTRDTNNAPPPPPKDFTFKSFLKNAGLPGQTKEPWLSAGAS